MEERLKNYRRALHRIPELGFDLPETKEFLLVKLHRLQCEIMEVCESGILVRFRASVPVEHRKPAIALRSDMDGLPVCEETGAQYSSRNQGRMHACGHDGHMAMLLGIAERLDRMRAEGRLVRDVILIFQPAEETTGGAREICNTELLDRFAVTAVFGFHLWPSLEAGVIGSRPGPLMAKSSEINVTVKGRSSHCALASEGIDAIEGACDFLIQAYQWMEQERKKGAYDLLKFGKLEGGAVRNAIAEEAQLLGTLRVFDLARFGVILSRLDEIGKAVGERLGCEFQVEYSEGYPPVCNQPNLFHRAKDVLVDGGFAWKAFEEPFLLAEDFSFYQQRYPGVFFFLGTGTGIPLHSCHFDFDERILLVGVDAYERLVESI